MRSTRSVKSTGDEAAGEAAAEMGVRLRNETWRNGGGDEDLSLTHLLPRQERDLTFVSSGI